MTDDKRNRQFAGSRERLRDLVESLHLFVVGKTIVETATRHVIVCGMHRSASTFVSQVLCRCLGDPLVSMAETFETAELARRLHQTAGADDPSRVTPTHDLYLPRLIVAAASGENTVSMHHVVANTQTLWFMTTVNGVRPIVTTRNIPDALVSVRDDLLATHPADGSSFAAKALADNYAVPFTSKRMWDAFRAGSPDEQMDMIIDLYGPWYFAFAASWEEVDAEKTHPVHFLRYEDMIADEPAVFADALTFLDSSLDRAAIDAALAEVYGGPKTVYRFNVGKSGRGRDELTKGQLDRLVTLGRHFADDGLIERYVST